MPLFDYCISNPPYQAVNGVHENGRVNFVRIFDKFHLAALNYASTSSMIYPSSWESNISKGFGAELINNGLQQVDNYNGSTIFGDSITQGYPVSIVLCKNGYQGEVCVNNIVQPRNSTILIDSPAKKLLFTAASNWPVKIPPPFANLLPFSNLAELKHQSTAFQESSDGLKNPVSVYLKRKPGTQSDATTFYVEEEVLRKLLVKDVDLELFTVSIPSSFFKQMRLFQVLLEDPTATFGAKVFPRFVVHGKTYKLLRRFSTEIEADNYARYLNTRIISILLACTPSLAEFGRFVPELDSYGEDAEVFWENERLPLGHCFRGLTLQQRLLIVFNVEADLNDSDFEQLLY